MSEEADLDLDSHRRAAGLTLEQLWYDYIALGGLQPIRGLEQHLAQPAGLTPLEHDVIAQALNERFMDLSLDHPVPYQRPA